MQIKKEIIREKLLEAGEREFFERGFTNSSVRKIAGLAGTTLGNFYNYFKNKEDLFKEIVKEEIIKFDDFFNGHKDEFNTDWMKVEMEPVAFCRAIDGYSDQLRAVFTRKFYIWVACSEGTEYSNSRKVVLEFIKEHFIGHVMEVGTKIPALDNTAGMLANGFLDGILYILKNQSEEAGINYLIKSHMLFFLMGSIGLIEGYSEGVAYD
ncbi:MAG: TetR/AcrR family transcriptional regulator [Clostridia bacterium]|nr:TetR/AcrR family transcriptional regulator [Clostridia bacterium]